MEVDKNLHFGLCEDVAQLSKVNVKMMSKIRRLLSGCLINRH